MERPAKAGLFFAVTYEMAQAKYTVHVPAQDEQGNTLRLHDAVHKHLTNLGGHASYVEGHPTHSVTAWAEEHPEWDSQAKQTGAFAGEIANVPSVMVTKEGKTPAAWHVANPFYRPGEPAEQAAFADEPNIATLGMEDDSEIMGAHPLSGPTNPAQLFL